jgi:diphosphomevalonate decarboxylase
MNITSSSSTTTCTSISHIHLEMAATCAQVTVRGSANIAVIKYWGKRDVKLNLPINSSLSGTLDQEHLSTVTTAFTSADLQEDELYINNERQAVLSNKRLLACLNALREAARTRYQPKQGQAHLQPTWGLRIVSVNNFPTAAGLASSASGFCCLGITQPTNQPTNQVAKSSTMSNAMMHTVPETVSLCL